MPRDGEQADGRENQNSVPRPDTSQTTTGSANAARIEASET